MSEKEEITLPRVGNESVATVVSYHYDMLMRMRRVRIRDANGVFDIVPMMVGGPLGAEELGLERVSVV